MIEVVRALRLWLRTAFLAAPLMVVLQCLLAVMQAVTAPAQVYGVKLLVDGITQHQNATIGWGIAVILGGFAVMFIGNIVGGPVQDTTAERVFGRVYRDLLDVTTSVHGLAHHERPDIADKVELIREHAWRLGVSFELLLFMVGTLANTVTVLGLLASVSPALLLLPLVGTARIWSAYVSGRMIQDAFEKMMPKMRLVDRLIEIAKDPAHAVELRVFGLRPVLIGRLRDLADERTHAESHAARRGAILDGSVRVGFGLAYALAIVWVIIAGRQGTLSAGDVVLVILVAPQVDQMAGGIAGNVYWLGEVLRSFGRYDWLREYAKEHSWETSTTPAPERLRRGITLQGVGFTYPKSETQPGKPGREKPEPDRPERGESEPGESEQGKTGRGGPDAPQPERVRVLSDIDLFLPAGSTVALVGENGAGKTTLVKLLARLYDPTDGAVLVDDTDLREIDPIDWRSRLSAGFQDFNKWELLARETVGIGFTDRLEDPEAIDRAVRRGDAEPVVERLPDGLETQLGKRFTGGQDLSGGQWQRLALARAFMRDRPLLLLLDEPTAALDPEAEHALFDRFADASKIAAAETGGVTILVSHRFSTVRMADLIVVLDNGRLLEVGTHEELLAAHGRYAELFEMQAKAYR